jgi:hypothetical protein
MESKNINSIYKEINKISLFFKNYVNKYLKQNTDFVYSKKSSLNDGLLYHLLKTKINSTQQHVTTNISLINKQKISRQALIKRSDLISITHLNNLYESLINKFNTFNTESTLSSVDGTKINIYNKNTDKGYKTINLLGIYNNNDLPTNIYKNNDLNKSEIQLFYEYINKNLFDKTKTIVLDRLYFSNKLINKCIDNNINFICRLKSNTRYLNKYHIFNKNADKIYNHNDYIVTLNNNKQIRIISFKQNEKIYHLASSLLDTTKYNINYFKNAYKTRWNIEIYFKITKANTNLNNIKTKKIDKINKEIISINIISFLYSYILKIYNKYTKNIKKINNTLFINKFYEHLLDKIINNKLTFKILKSIIEIIIITYNDTNKNNINKRYSIMPYTKWHYKYIFKELL